jgi:hypothetical protein
VQHYTTISSSLYRTVLDLAGRCDQTVSENMYERGYMKLMLKCVLECRIRRIHFIKKFMNCKLSNSSGIYVTG